MYKVLFADDEPLMLEGLRILLDWEELDFEICGEALDGEDALRLIHSTRPDLVITDVRMPVIDGLELIKRTYESEHRPRFIIFSGYADFEYAKRALKYGVSSYLTKPLDEQELKDALKTVSEQIDIERRVSSRHEAISALMQADTVSRLLMREKTEEELHSALKTLGISSGSRLCCILVQGPSPDSLSIRNQLNAINGEEPLRSIAAYPFTAGSRKHGYLLVSPQDGPSLDPAMLRSWIRGIRGLYGAQVLFSASLQHYGPENLNKIYQEALTAALCHPGAGSREAACFFQEQDKPQVALLPAELRRSLLQFITEGNTERLSTVLGDVFKIFTAEVNNSSWIDAFLANIKAELLREIEARGGDYAAWKKKWFPPQYTACCLPLLERQTEEELIEAAEWFAAAEKSSREDGMVEAVKEHVREYYREKLKLQDIAKALHVNSAYLGQRFKKHCGSSFNEFLHEYRIEEAKKLLRRTDMGISDISTRVGYSDADLFAAKFKALNGVTPSVYKKS
ncbi:response regulator transcription factor [Paenibacillus sp. MMS20-IR301]|uniref:response regulator transcription factor n=1 Tax=Paenibacillus sp. MMS20-IR301 TaxID=2895946 RepID=UPI0028E79593|nr:response regulator transcription factor [Paenibacillus sp. MMS20-IR301]WNS46056.1 response regulator transcription factor [Paenibacillus sp. MMS20-IR301]